MEKGLVTKLTQPLHGYLLVLRREFSVHEVRWFRLILSTYANSSAVQIVFIHQISKTWIRLPAHKVAVVHQAIFMFTPSPYSGSSSWVSSVGLSSSSVQYSGSTPLSSRDTTQQLITGLAACQRSIEELLQTVRSSNERIEELAEKVKILDGRVEKLSSHPVDGTESGSGGRGEKRKRTKSYLLVQVCLKILTEKPWIAVV